jgi:hypothetical protein
MLEQLSLANPVRYDWTLHDRELAPNTTCPAGEEYLVVQRNFDITTSPLNQVQYSPYVNGTLWTYVIEEACTGPNPLALAVPVQVDPSADGITQVAGNAASLQLGGFYFNLTRDDVAGLRYLLTTNNINFESPALGSVLLSSTQSGGTNFGAPFPLFTSDLTSFILSAQTNSPTILSNLFPGLIITSSSNFFTVVQTPNIVAFFTNLIGAPAGSQTLVIATNGFTITVVTNFVDTFANVVTNTFFPNSSFKLVTVQVQQLNGAPAGILTTNTTTKTIITNVPSGDFYINTNPCGPDVVLSTLFTNVVETTNLLLIASNSAGLFFSQSEESFATNHILIVEPIICGAAAGGGATTNAPGLFQGLGKLQFVRTTFDSLLGQFFQPVTNTYTMEMVSNSKLVNQTFQRVVTAPDFLISAGDLASGPGDGFPPVVSTYARNINFDQANALPGLAGPGTIDAPTTIAFNKSGGAFFNNVDGNELTEISSYVWGSFDASTNDPIVYPDGTSIANLANQVLVQITPTTLPDGTNGVAYPATTFVAVGGAFTPPFTWSLPSGGLPSGLTLSSSGTISGTPTQSGTFDFTLQLTDVVSRSVQWNYTLIIQ